MSRPCLLLAALAVVGGCTMTRAVTGQIQNSSETFTGSATGGIDGSGDLAVTTTSGAVCTGTFVYVTERRGEGTFRCSDGRTGPFHFASTGSRGTGEGDLGGQHFTFTFQ